MDYELVSKVLDLPNEKLEIIQKMVEKELKQRSLYTVKNQTANG